MIIMEIKPKVVFVLIIRTDFIYWFLKEKCYENIGERRSRLRRPPAKKAMVTADQGFHLHWKIEQGKETLH